MAKIQLWDFVREALELSLFYYIGRFENPREEQMKPIHILMLFEQTNENNT